MAERKFLRFSRSARLQHIFMFVPFILLVITGFPIKFPDSGFWAFSIELVGGIDTLRRLHRAAALVMILDFAVHVLLLLRWFIRIRPGYADIPLAPQLQDAKDIVTNIRYYLFKSDERPHFRRFSYIEKFDYWAVFWGMLIMAGSGTILWFPVPFSRVLSGDWIRIAYVAHSDEALLAFLAIAIWHFYNVHFNPRVWPANMVWLRGTMTESEMRHEHPAELEEILEREANRRRGERNRRSGDRRTPLDDRRSTPGNDREQL